MIKPRRGGRFIAPGVNPGKLNQTPRQPEAGFE